MSILLGFDSTVLEAAYRWKRELPLDDATKAHFEKFPISHDAVIVMDGNYKPDEQMETVSAIYWGEDTFMVKPPLYENLFLF